MTLLTCSKSRNQKVLEASQMVCDHFNDLIYQLINCFKKLCFTVVTLGSNIVPCYFSHQLVWHQSKAYEKTSVRWQLANSRQTTIKGRDVWWHSFSETFGHRWNCSVANPLKYSLCRPIPGKTKKGQFITREAQETSHTTSRGVAREPKCLSSSDVR